MDQHLKFFNKKPPPQIPIFQKNIIFFGTTKNYLLWSYHYSRKVGYLFVKEVSGGGGHYLHPVYSSFIIYYLSKNFNTLSSLQIRFLNILWSTFKKESLYSVNCNTYVEAAATERVRLPPTRLNPRVGSPHKTVRRGESLAPSFSDTLSFLLLYLNCKLIEKYLFNTLV